MFVSICACMTCQSTLVSLALPDRDEEQLFHRAWPAHLPVHHDSGGRVGQENGSAASFRVKSEEKVRGAHMHYLHVKVLYGHG